LDLEAQARRGLSLPKEGGNPQFLEPFPARQESNWARFCPFPVSPKGKGRGGRETPTPQKTAAPPARGFSKRPAENPLCYPPEQTAPHQERRRFAEGQGHAHGALNSLAMRIALTSVKLQATVLYGENTELLS
jgi:hypothetical protein